MNSFTLLSILSWIWKHFHENKGFGVSTDTWQRWESSCKTGHVQGLWSMTSVRVIPGHPALARSLLTATQTPWAAQLPAASQVFTCHGPAQPHYCAQFTCGWSSQQPAFTRRLFLLHSNLGVNCSDPKHCCCVSNRVYSWKLLLWQRERRIRFRLKNSGSEGHFCTFRFSAGLSWCKFS